MTCLLGQAAFFQFIASCLSLADLPATTPTDAFDDAELFEIDQAIETELGVRLPGGANCRPTLGELYREYILCAIAL
jgi:hypothetical protein